MRSGRTEIVGLTAAFFIPIVIYLAVTTSDSWVEFENAKIKNELLRHKKTIQQENIRHKKACKNDQSCRDDNNN